jgi:hypothetical protein
MLLQLLLHCCLLESGAYDNDYYPHLGGLTLSLLPEKIKNLIITPFLAYLFEILGLNISQYETEIYM